MAHRALDSSGLLTEQDAILIFEKAMSEEGVDPDAIEVVMWDDGVSLSEHIGFIVGKHINGKMERRKVSVASTFDADTSYIEQRIASAASTIATAFREDMIHTLEVCGTRLRFCSAEGGWAECDRCGTKVTLTDCANRLGFTETAEFSNPEPTPYDVQDFLQRLDDGRTEVLKFYLFGALQKECHCGFGKRTPKDLSRGNPYKE